MVGGARATMIVVLAWAAIGCGKGKPVPAATPVAATVAGDAGPAGAPHTPERMAKAYHDIRCAQVTGVAAPYAQHGFAGSEEFTRAFATFAQAEPDAAKAAVAASYARPCAGDARPQPTAATPAGAP